MNPTSTSTGFRPAIRPLGRRRPVDVRLDGIDRAWMGFIAFVALVFAAIVHSLVIAHIAKHVVVNAAVLPVFAALGAGAYLFGRLIKDRSAGVAAGLLTATSLTMAAGSLISPASCFAALFIIAALIALARDHVIVSFGLAVVAACFRLDCMVVGIGIAAGAIAMRRTNIALGFAVYLLGLLLICAVRIWVKIPIGIAMSHRAHWADWHSMPVALGCTLLFVVPLLTEIAEKERRARWIASIIIMLLSGVAALFSTRSQFSAMTPVLGVIWLLLGAGMSRLMPSAAGDMPTPAGRYAAATFGIILVLIMRFATERTGLSIG